MISPPTYVIITPARNEAEFIELTIKSVIAQTVRPLRWVIVSDGSTDGTDEIVNRYSSDYPWIELVRMPERSERHFAGKVFAFNAGHARVKALEYEVICNLDADTSFEKDYFAFLLKKLVENPELGLVGTPFFEGESTYNFRFSSIEHVSGACQMFRRKCFEDIGGYYPVRSGGIDVIAALSSRVKGWQTRTFTEKAYFHHRKMGTAQHVGYHERLHTGHKDYLLGSHPIWEVFRSIYQMKTRPYFIGGILMLGAYVWDLLRGVERTMPKDLIEFRRKDQMRRLKAFLLRSDYIRTLLDQAL